jgi:trans-2,3-dihydro-3-hydroxyanthranilate isomerase
MPATRRNFLQLGSAGLTATLISRSITLPSQSSQADSRRYRFVQIDVFTSRRLEGNKLPVFPDARGLSDAEMQNIARETNLQETTFVFPRDPALEKEHGIKVRIFLPQQEIPFAGHPTLGTAFVLRNQRARELSLSANDPALQEISLDLQVGKIPIAFQNDDSGNVFGEMRQVDPVFGQIHNRSAVAAMIGLQPDDISDDAPIQTVSTGLPFAIVPVKQLSKLQSLDPDFKKVRSYFAREKLITDFYYVTRDSRDPHVGLRSRGLFGDGEDSATGSAAGCTASWMVRYGLAASGQQIKILQGVEMKRPSQIFVRAEKQADMIHNVRVGGHAINILHGELQL